MFVSCFEFRLDSLKKLCQASAVLSYEHVYIATLDVEVSKNVSCKLQEYASCKHYNHVH